MCLQIKTGPYKIKTIYGTSIIFTNALCDLNVIFNINQVHDIKYP